MLDQRSIKLYTYGRHLPWGMRTFIGQQLHHVARRKYSLGKYSVVILCKTGNMLQASSTGRVPMYSLQRKEKRASVSQHLIILHRLRAGWFSSNSADIR